jgi:hypothetical protein
MMRQSRHRNPGLRRERDREAMDQQERRQIEKRLAELRVEHRDLDDVIAHLAEQAPFDQLQVQRLKKRKLRLKDEINQLENKLLPDIIA